MTTLTVRAAQPSDVIAITSIINHYITHTPATFDLEPHSVEQRTKWLAQFQAAHGRYRLFVAERAGEVTGYADTHRFRDKAAYDATVECSVYVAPEALGQGIGSALYQVLFDALAEADVHRVLAGITQPNPASVALHRRFGFESCGVMHEVGRKHGRLWDVEWFERRA